MNTKMCENIVGKGEIGHKEHSHLQPECHINSLPLYPKS